MPRKITSREPPPWIVGYVAHSWTVFGLKCSVMRTTENGHKKARVSFIYSLRDRILLEICCHAAHSGRDRCRDWHQLSEFARFPLNG